ncbi:hypothetical protein EV191_101941 [Tamaricihabitans halophyticus]|uniref:Uncharacterized protein n=1 Tax=Tamaricihabitans halophyticus TaxID=1262583 RepID=A0A4R2RBA9_9PSEU|nr:hypothetical protein [Tamaricihabitans halophyticus]TCP56991.1 hypothetical protein EV191_101941 [Tamaricihabitans halophyticus]
MTRPDQRAWDALRELEEPAQLQDWQADREDIAQARQRLRAGATALGPAHPAAGELLTCARRIDEWLVRTGRHASEQAAYTAADEYNRVIVPELRAAARRLRPALDNGPLF